MMVTLRYTCVQTKPVWFASLGSEEVVMKKVPEAIFVHGCHGNTELHVRTKFHLRTLYIWCAS